MERNLRCHTPVRKRWILACTVMALLLSGCSRKLLSVFFDVPPAPMEDPQKVAVPVPVAQYAVAAPEDTVRPEIENFLHPDSARVRLPRDHAGNIDWMQALNKGVIKPRSSLPGQPPGEGTRRSEFAFDFFFPGASSMFDAYFPHSSHTQWLSCKQCHPRIFRQRGTKISMADLTQGKYCGECHGKVAFPVTTGCERCHPAFPQPPNRAQPNLIGNIKMKRIAPEEVDTLVVAESRSSSLASVFPVATFPHWVHRIRFRCKVCHMDIFEPVAGSNAITMKDIRAGKACGNCHNGKIAFDAGFGSCARCHLEPAFISGGS